MSNIIAIKPVCSVRVYLSESHLYMDSCEHGNQVEIFAVLECYAALIGI
jgi:hypothetical protein